MRLRWTLILSALCIFPSVKTYPRGAPKSACQSMNPQHGVPEQNTTIPYQLIPEVESVSAGETVQLTLNKADVEAIADFKGIMIEAVNVEDETIVGRFEER